VVLGVVVVPFVRRVWLGIVWQGCLAGLGRLRVLCQCRGDGRTAQQHRNKARAPVSLFHLTVPSKFCMAHAV